MKSTGYNSIRSWGIALACSYINCMGLLPMRIAGLLFVAFLDRYDTDRPNAALFVVIHGVLATSTSPLIGYLGEIFDLRSITIWGSLITCLGVGMSYFAEDIIIVTISLGLIYGIGIALQLTLLPQVLKQHFTKNIASANGFKYMGTCVGHFVIIPVFKILLDIYGVSGALLLTCGLMLHSVPVAMLLRDPKYKKTPISSQDKESSTKDEQMVFIETVEEKSSIDIDSDLNEKTLSNSPVIKYNKTCVVEKDCANLNVCVTGKNEDSYKTENVLKCNAQLTESNQDPLTKTPLLSSINIKKDIAIEEHGKICINEINQNPSCEKPPTISKSIYIKALKTLTILRNPPFIVIMICHSVYGYISVFLGTIIIDISKDKGIPESQAQFFLMLSPIAQTFGYICLGWVTDKGYLTPSRFLAIGSLCLGLSCFGFVVSNSFLAMLISVVGYGLCVSVIRSVGPSLVYEFVEETKQTMAIASRYILHAPLCFTMGPTLRYFRGTLGSYDGALYLLVAYSVLCAVLLLFLPCVARHTNRKKEYEK